MDEAYFLLKSRQKAARAKAIDQLVFDFEESQVVREYARKMLKAYGQPLYNPENVRFSNIDMTQG